MTTEPPAAAKTSAGSAAMQPPPRTAWRRGGEPIRMTVSEVWYGSEEPATGGGTNGRPAAPSAGR
ncbi:hypothetical protein [Streptomyces sp. NBC_01233]|uniref:hypothetical protein n=1 Tax=Streptomyces sp. NBC_01233 TaxID=2903787 RepID=UPI002E114893|nr:hypothetical protein OG332_39630 [Streptomyces sp. NBC_01233]